MKKSLLLYTSLLVGSLSASLTYAQDYWNPFGTASDGTLHYDTTTGELRIPSLKVRANRFDPGTLLYDVVLTHLGNETFRVVSSRNLLDSEECTRAEVSAAMSQLRLDMTVAEASTLIGCEAVTSARGTNLTSGRLVEASWVGQDGAPNPGNSGYVSFFVVGAPSNWVPAAGSVSTPSGAPVRNFSSGGPAIVFSLREGVLESYTYVNQGPSRVCDNDALEAGFGLLKKGDSRAHIEQALECEGTLGKTTVSAGAVQEQLSWRSRTMPLVPSIPAELDNNNIEVTLVNGAMTQATKMSSTSQYLPSPCSTEQIETMANSVEVGMSEDALKALSNCPASSVTAVDTGSSITGTYHWNSQNTSDSIYLSVNRSLTVSVHAGVVSTFSLQRH